MNHEVKWIREVPRTTKVQGRGEVELAMTILILVAVATI